MNEFYLNYKESQNAYAEYQQEVEDWEKGCNNVVVSKDKTRCQKNLPDCRKMQKSLGRMMFYLKIEGQDKPL